MARRPTPTPILKIRGSRHARGRHDELQPGGTAGDCPDWLNENGKAKWRELIAVLEPLGLATAADRGALTQYCEAWQDYRDALEVIAKHGAEIIGSKGTLVASPAVHRRQSAWSRLAKLATEFGLTPAARVSLNIKPKEAKSSKARFFQK